MTLLGCAAQAQGAQIQNNWQLEHEKLQSFYSEGKTIDFVSNDADSMFKNNVNATTRYLGWKLPSNSQVTKLYEAAYPPNLHSVQIDKYSHSINLPNDRELNYRILFQSNYVSRPVNDYNPITNEDIDSLSRRLAIFTMLDTKLKSSKEKSALNLVGVLIPNAYLLK